MIGGHKLLFPTVAAFAPRVASVAPSIEASCLGNLRRVTPPLREDPKYLGSPMAPAKGPAGNFPFHFCHTRLPMSSVYSVTLFPGVLCNSLVTTNDRPNPLDCFPHHPPSPFVFPNPKTSDRSHGGWYPQHIAGLASVRTSNQSASQGPEDRCGQAGPRPTNHIISTVPYLLCALLVSRNGEFCSL